MNEKYRVDWYIDNPYQVLDRETDAQLHQGSLSDCEAWIRRREGGYL